MARLIGRRPPANWAVLRIGYSLLGITNHPASPEGTGLEVDKLSRRAREDVHDDLSGSTTRVRRPADGEAWSAVPDHRQLGSRRAELDRERARGVPASAADTTRTRGCPSSPGTSSRARTASDRFLWDFRRTLADMLAEYHYDQITAIAQSARDGPLRRITRRRPCVHRRRHGGQAHQRCPDGAMWTQRPGVNAEPVWL